MYNILHCNIHLADLQVV